MGDHSGSLFSLVFSPQHVVFEFLPTSSFIFRIPLNCCLLLGWSKIELTASNEACSGAVIVHSQMGKSRVYCEGWTKTEVDILCQNLECGSSGSKGSMESDILLTTNFTYAGGKEPKTIWDCKNQTAQNPTAQQLSITCQGKIEIIESVVPQKPQLVVAPLIFDLVILLLSFPGEPTVDLSSGCSGKLTMNNIEVCGNEKSWTEYNSKLVCQERGCGNYIAASFSERPEPTKEYFQFSCEETHYQLGQCKRFKGTCDQKLVSVYCVGKCLCGFCTNKMLSIHPSVNLS